MHLTVRSPFITRDENGTMIGFRLDPDAAKDLEQNADYLLQSKLIDLDIHRLYEKRSKNANAMFWSMCQKLAMAMGTTNDEMYLELLNRYGSCNVVTCDWSMREVYRETLEQFYRFIRAFQEPVQINGAKCAQFFCYKGTHTYNTQEMSRLIQGTVNDCKEIGIPTEPQQDILQAIHEWGAVKPYVKEEAEEQKAKGAEESTAQS